MNVLNVSIYREIPFKKVFFLILALNVRNDIQYCTFNLVILEELESILVEGIAQHWDPVSLMEEGRRPYSSNSWACH